MRVITQKDLQSNLMQQFTDCGIIINANIHVTFTISKKGDQRRAIKYAGKVIIVYDNFAVIETSSGYKVTLSRFDLSKILIEVIH